MISQLALCVVSVCVRRNLIKLARPGHGHNSKHAAPRSSLCPEGFDTTPPVCMDGAAAGEAEVPRIEQIAVVTEINGISFFLFLFLRTVRIVILYH